MAKKLIPIVLLIAGGVSHYFHTRPPTALILTADCACYAHREEGVASQMKESQAALRFQERALTDQITQAESMSTVQRSVRRLEIAAAGCDHACLVGFADQFMTALTARMATKLLLATNVKFTENGAALAVGDGMLKARTKLVTRRDVFADPTGGQVASPAARSSASRPSCMTFRTDRFRDGLHVAPNNRQ